MPGKEVKRRVRVSPASDAAVGGAEQTVCTFWSCSEVTGLPQGGGLGGALAGELAAGNGKLGASSLLTWRPPSHPFGGEEELRLSPQSGFENSCGLKDIYSESQVRMVCSSVFSLETKCFYSFHSSSFQSKETFHRERQDEVNIAKRDFFLVLDHAGPDQYLIHFVWQTRKSPHKYFGVLREGGGRDFGTRWPLHCVTEESGTRGRGHSVEDAAWARWTGDVGVIVLLP